MQNLILKQPLPLAVDICEWSRAAGSSSVEVTFTNPSAQRSCERELALRGMLSQSIRMYSVAAPSFSDFTELVTVMFSNVARSLVFKLSLPPGVQFS